MARQVKCQQCGQKGDKEKMIQEKSKKYYHAEVCHGKFIKQQEFKTKEREELHNLVELIKDIHDKEVIPGGFFPYLQGLRNGDVLFGKVKKQYKKGVSFNLIADTYEYCKDKIDWAKKNKRFDDTMQELKYGLAIVKNNIDKVKDLNRIRDIQKQLQEADYKKHCKDYVETELKYKKKENKNDISEFL